MFVYSSTESKITTISKCPNLKSLVEHVLRNPPQGDISYHVGEPFTKDYDNLLSSGKLRKKLGDLPGLTIL